MSVTDYTTLQAHIADTLNRTDLTAQIPVFIQSCEARLRRDKRARKLQDRQITVSADNYQLPSDLHSIQALYHEGPTYFGQIDVVSAEDLGYYKGVYGAGTTGAPGYAAVISGYLRFAPVPDQTYTLRMPYWLKIEPLSASNPTNWIITDHPDIYIYGTLLESAPFLKHDERMDLWRTEYDARLGELSMATEDAQWGGPMRRQFKPIG